MRTTLLPFLLLAPALIAMTIVLFYPISQGFFYSFTTGLIYALGHGIQPKIVGLDNYLRAFDDYVFWLAFQNTILMGVSTVVGSFSLGLMAALLVNQINRGKGIVRTIYLIPWAVPSTVSAVVWRWMYQPYWGLITYYLSQLGFMSTEESLLTSANTSLPATILVNIWTFFPFAMLVLLAGLQTIPVDLYEAAKIDGASTWSRFRNITFPLLKPISSITILLSLLWSFSTFNLIYVMTRGGPAHSTELLATWIFNNAIQFTRLEYASAMATIMFIFMMFLTIIYLKVYGLEVKMR